MALCKRFRVIGRVQGVFFRVSTQEMAIRIGLSGWVRNTREGDVELVVCGDQNQLSQLEHWLSQGPPHADVRELRCEPIADEKFSDFSIRY